MKKVTVIHYLEKKVKPTLIYGDVLAYPLYVRITVNRATTQIKSLTGALMSEKAFSIYADTGKKYNYETKEIGGVNFHLSIEKEVELIQLCVETLLMKKNNFNFSSRNIRTQLAELLTSTRESITRIGWEYSPSIVDGDTAMFLYSFNQKQTLILNIKFIEELLKIDIKKYVPSDFFQMWQVIELIKCIATDGMPVIKFVNIDYLEELRNALHDPQYMKYCFISEEYPLTFEIVKERTNFILRMLFYPLLY